MFVPGLLHYEGGLDLFEMGFNLNYIDRNYFRVEWAQETKDISMKRIT